MSMTAIGRERKAAMIGREPVYGDAVLKRSIEKSPAMVVMTLARVIMYISK